jgi:hypothetical protein
MAIDHLGDGIPRIVQSTSKDENSAMTSCLTSRRDAFHDFVDVCLLKSAISFRNAMKGYPRLTWPSTALVAKIIEQINVYSRAISPWSLGAHKRKCQVLD